MAKNKILNSSFFVLRFISPLPKNRAFVFAKKANNFSFFAKKMNYAGHEEARASFFCRLSSLIAKIQVLWRLPAVKKKQVLYRLPAAKKKPRPKKEEFALFFRLCFLFILLFFPFFTLADLLIVEIQIKGEFSSNDFIKIHNPLNKEISIEGYKLRKRTSSGKEYSIRAFPKTSSVSAKGYFLWANSKDDFHKTIVADAWSTAAIAQNNSIALIGPDNQIIDAVSWGENENPFNENGIPENPESKLIRKNTSGIYQNTKDNALDFYFEPSPQPDIEKTKDKTESNAAAPIAPSEKEQSPELKQSAEQETKAKPLEKINVNTAPIEDLIKIIHIGEARAHALIALRPFFSLSDLIRIKGIGEKSAQDIKNQGLAWVEGEEEREDSIKDSPKKQITPSYYETPANAPPKKTALIAIVISIFSGTAIYLTAKKFRRTKKG